MTVVHIAAPPEAQIQRCSRCQEILIDVRNAMVPIGSPGPGCWGVGCYVGVEGNRSYVRDYDANGPDEMPCNRRIQ
jgi:hypothetical protein